MQYQWYPGHMTKAKRMMEENLKLIDLIIEIVDARIPMSSRNPDIDKMGKSKFRVILLNKSDLADGIYNKKWLEYFKEKGFFAVSVNARNGSGLNDVKTAVRSACAAKTARDRERGIISRPVRAMVVGIPNVGKSTFINAFAGKACTKTGNKPGVTKGKQWIKLNKELELLDTPGLLWPKLDQPTEGIRLAMIGAINDEIIDKEDLALHIIDVIDKRYAGMLQSHYNISAGQTFDIDVPESYNLKEAYNLLHVIAMERHCYAKGGQPDLKKAAAMITDEFKNGKIGRVTLDFID